MVDKIDRPESRPHYKIREAKETKEDQHHQQDPKEELEKQYKKQLEGDGKEWSKFGQRSTVIKPFRVETNRIQKMLFGAANLYKGVGILQLNVLWKDGRQTKGALMRLQKMEDYFKLKKLSPGDELPAQYWSGEKIIELGIVHSIAASGPFPMQPPEKAKIANHSFQPGSPTAFFKKIGVLDARTEKIKWGVVALYTFVIIVISTALYLELR